MREWLRDITKVASPENNREIERDRERESVCVCEMKVFLDCARMLKRRKGS